MKHTVNFLNIRTPKKFVVLTLNFELCDSTIEMSPNDADGMANSVDPDQTAPLGAPLGAVWSGSALFVQAYLSENLGSLQYVLVDVLYGLPADFIRSGHTSCCGFTRRLNVTYCAPWAGVGGGGTHIWKWCIPAAEGLKMRGVRSGPWLKHWGFWH